MNKTVLICDDFKDFLLFISRTGSDDDQFIFITNNVECAEKKLNGRIDVGGFRDYTSCGANQEILAIIKTACDRSKENFWLEKMSYYLVQSPRQENPEKPKKESESLRERLMGD